MEDTVQDHSQTKSAVDEQTVESPKVSIDKSDSIEMENTSTDHIEEQENAEDFSSARSQSESDCSERSRTASDREEDDASIILEQDDADGQDSQSSRKVDDDEDKRNPQYIPKKGTFYEHDDRTAIEEGDEELAEDMEIKIQEKDSVNKKKVWSEKEASKWSHDRFNDMEQAPKSKQELIAIYGYDIRNEEGPPRARRRRRYGRGPNKYTRNWEDEEAYSKPTNVSVKPNKRKPRTKSDQEEFPPLNPQHSRNEAKSSDHNESKTFESTVNANTENRETNNRFPNEGNVNSREIQVNKIQVTEERDQNERKIHENSNYPKREARQYSSVGRNDSRNNKSPQKRSDEPVRVSTGPSIKGVTKTRGFFKNGGRGIDSTRVRNQKNQRVNNADEDYSDYIMSQNFTNKSMSRAHNVQKLESDLGGLSLKDPGETVSSGGNLPAYAGVTHTRGGGKYGGSGSGRQINSVPPRLQQDQRGSGGGAGGGSGSKRYSSLRQRSLPETAGAQSYPQATYYSTEYSQQASSQAPQTQTQAGLLPHPQQQQAAIHSQVSSSTTPQLMTVVQSQTINPIPAMQAPPPPQYAPQPYAQGPPPPFLQPTVAAGVAPFIAQQAPPPPPQIINYGQPPPPPQFTGQFGNYQHQQFNPVNQAQPAELYQPQGGITYYSPQNQQVMPRIPQKRVKAAIPIVAPPEHQDTRSRGRNHNGGGSNQVDPDGGHVLEGPVESYADQTNNTSDFSGVEAPVVVQQ